MVTGAIKNKVDKIWTDIWAGGITNPLTVIEQLTYLMFLIPTPQVLQKIITGSESWVPPLWALPVLPSPRWFPSF